MRITNGASASFLEDTAGFIAPLSPIRERKVGEREERREGRGLFLSFSLRRNECPRRRQSNDDRAVAAFRFLLFPRKEALRHGHSERSVARGLRRARRNGRSTGEFVFHST
jgi:hypothetical protein